MFVLSTLLPCALLPSLSLQAMRLNANGLGGQKRPHEMMGMSSGGMDGMNQMVPVGGGGMGMSMPMGMNNPMQGGMPLQPPPQVQAPGQGPMMSAPQQQQQQPAPKRAKTDDVLRQVSFPGTGCVFGINPTPIVWAVEAMASACG